MLTTDTGGREALVDPISIIVAALVAGAAAGAKDTATAAVKDAYSAFRMLLRRHFGDDEPAVDSAATEAGSNTSPDTTDLRQRLEATDAANNSALVEAAVALLQQVQPGVTITITDSKGVIGANYGTSTMTFNEGG